MSEIPTSDASVEQLKLLIALAADAHDIPGDIVEVGSWKCGTSSLLALTNPHKEVHAFDLFGGLPYGDGKGFENFADVQFDEIRARTSEFVNLHLVRGLHETTIPEFSPRLLSLIFMDSDHYSSHKVALTHLVPMLSSKGMIVFHDWGFPEVQQAIRESIKPEQFPEPCFALQMGILRKL